MTADEFNAFVNELKSGNLDWFNESARIEEIQDLSEAQLLKLVDDGEDICLGRIRKVRGHLEARLVDKNEHVIPMALACTIAQVPMVLLGPPGTAKSQVIHMLCDALGLREDPKDITSYEDDLQLALRARDSGSKGAKQNELPVELRRGDRQLFEYLVTRFTTPEEIVGTANIDAMLKFSLFYRQSNGMLPQVQIAFLDEIFKANSAILNALLSIINERIYYNAGQAFNVNLLMVFGASNEAPDTEELGALYDRFPVRVLSEPVGDHKTWDLMEKSLAGAFEKAIPAPSTNGDGNGRRHALASVNDFRLLARTCHVRYGGKQAFTDRTSTEGFSARFVKLFNDLRGEFGISDRTPERLFRVSKALAMLGDDKGVVPASLEPKRHLTVFKHVAPRVESARVLADIVDASI